ncbi:alpha/beta hydrolase [Halomonas sp. McH1-25]|uniref:alpha/beta fold hydrolase n=1 Tax=unclassified Halomonas TaxID=2609666 RepID=UPI001EF6C42A|nr:MULTISPECIES: alpha/beta fold hydrolase [unclassified Halomonas]MCG7600696.1 alpha/beta hydrolase [Halomonas sp. McH1-25]MCP1341274.1 alpha/beta hydrolase [Halomonas sp. FL8]MCP1361833.1 alpha/beta hydrolase [Halomonas sp. BBD45]MCP1367008.1 alpha/beta hydrolase [Halomonas sp. BBD48]
MSATPERHEAALNQGAVHVTRFRPTSPCRGVVLCWHGAIESGRIFYSRSGKGLAPWLANQGYDVFVADQRGRHEAPPRPARGVTLDQTDVIREEIPATIEACLALANARRLHVVTHSWGGVLVASSLGRYPQLRDRIISQAYFGTKRSVRSWTWQRLLYIDLMWKGVAPVARRLCGYLPARALRWGSDDEYAGSHRQGVAWVKASAWIDARDGFDYSSALASGGLPPTLHLTGTNDRALGHPDDVARFAQECGPHVQRLVRLGISAGQTRDYGHLDMLTHPQAATEVYPLVDAWLTSHARPGEA